MRWGFHFVDPRSAEICHLEYCHNFVIRFLVGIVIFVLIIIIGVYLRPYYVVDRWERPGLEFMITLSSFFILFWISIVCLHATYFWEREEDRGLTLKVVGNQWFWHYSYDGYGFSFDSYTVPLDLLGLGGYRLLEVDERVVLPLFEKIRFIVTSSDVIHSFFIPSIGIKIDCNVGRMNRKLLYFVFPGLYYGSCTEICGANHSFISICLELVSYSIFLGWASLNKLIMY